MTPIASGKIRLTPSGLTHLDKFWESHFRRVLPAG